MYPVDYVGDDMEFVPRYGFLSTFSEERQNNPFLGD